MVYLIIVRVKKRETRTSLHGSRQPEVKLKTN
jgi:hypothetical protein